MTPEQANIQIRKALDAMQPPNSDLGELMVQLANQAKTRMRQRITETGYNAAGSPFADYTPQYKKYKTKKKHYSGFVDFAFSGQMWSNVQVISSTDEHNGGVARISAPNPDQYVKLEGNTAHKGTILDLNDKEIAELNDSAEKWILKYWNW